MSLAESLLPEFDHEMAGVRKALERVPADNTSWRPHTKSMSIGRLATHLAELPRFLPSILRDDELDLYPPGAEPFELQTPLPPDQALALFDENLAQARAMLAAATDAQLMQPWTLKAAGHPIFTLPRVAAYRTAVMNHALHHRGQLTVYLRLNDVPVPGFYGPSADEREAH